MRVSHVKDGKADDFVDPPKQPLEQLATDDILAKGSEHMGVGIGELGRIMLSARHTLERV